MPIRRLGHSLEGVPVRCRAEPQAAPRAATQPGDGRQRPKRSEAAWASRRQELMMSGTNLNQLQAPQQWLIDRFTLGCHPFIARGTPRSYTPEQEWLGKEPLKRQQCEIA